VVDEVDEGEYYVVFGVVQCVLGRVLVLPVSAGIAELLDEGGELALDVTAQDVLRQFAQSLNLHGA
jgi:hypothetical protein